MKKLSLLIMLFALLLTACSDSENEDPNGGGGTNTGKIVGLNIKDAKLIYGVERSSAKSMLKSSGSSNYFRQVTKGNKNMEVTWVTEKGDTTSIITIDAIANLSDDYIIINTRNPIDEPNMAMPGYFSYIINKNTGLILNPENPIEGDIDLININDYTSYYDKERYCYVKGTHGNIFKIDLQSYSVEQIFENADDIKILANGSFFVHMRDGNHKYGSFRLNEVHEFSDMRDRYLGWDNYIPVYGINDWIVSIICNKKNTDGTTTYSIFYFSGSENPFDYGFSDIFDQPQFKFNSDFELPKNILIGGNVLTPISVSTSRTSQIIYIGTPDGQHGILINHDAINSLSQLSNDLIGGFISEKRFDPYNLNHYPNIAVNSMASFNYKDNGDLVITEFSTLTQKTIKDVKGYRIMSIMGKYSDETPVTFIGDKLEKVGNNGWLSSVKQCVGTIDSKGNAEILQEFDSNDNEAMNGFLMELN